MELHEKPGLRPFAHWDLSSLSCPAAPTTTAEAMRIVTTIPKLTIKSHEQVPEHLIARCPISTLMQRPKSLNPDFRDWDWFPQLHTAFVLKIPNGFIGDNVVFDRNNYYSFDRWWLGQTWELYRKVTQIRYEPYAISIASWGGEAFQHFIKDTIPKLAMILDSLESQDLARFNIVTHRDHCTVAQWFWQKLGLQDRIVQKPINAKEGVVINTRMSLFTDCAPSSDSYGLHPRNSLAPVQRRLGLLEGTTQDLVVYLPRSGNRSVANEMKLLSTVTRLLEGRPYKLHCFQSSGNFDTDLEIFKRARIVFGPHGGAFANLVFAQPGTRVIEFLPLYRIYRDGGHPRRSCWGLSQAAGLDYWTVEPDNFSFDRPGMIVDCEEIARIIKPVLDDYQG